MISLKINLMNRCTCQFIGYEGYEIIVPLGFLRKARLITSGQAVLSAGWYNKEPGNNYLFGYAIL
jgi:hypothetical protein